MAQPGKRCCDTWQIRHKECMSDDAFIQRQDIEWRIPFLNLCSPLFMKSQNVAFPGNFKVLEKVVIPRMPESRVFTRY
jgi:hypothetical protein